MFDRFFWRLWGSLEILDPPFGLYFRSYTGVVPTAISLSKMILRKVNNNRLPLEAALFFYVLFKSPRPIAFAISYTPNFR